MIISSSNPKPSFFEFSKNPVMYGSYLLNASYNLIPATSLFSFYEPRARKSWSVRGYSSKCCTAPKAIKQPRSTRMNASTMNEATLVPRCLVCQVGLEFSMVLRAWSFLRRESLMNYVPCLLIIDFDNWLSLGGTSRLVICLDSPIPLKSPEFAWFSA